MKLSKKTILDANLEGKTVLVRCDFNVPLVENKNITDNARIVKALDTIKYILDKNTKIILTSHLGRPKGEFNMEYSLEPVRKELERLLKRKVVLAKDVIGEDADKKVSELQTGDILLLENVRFEKGETENDDEMSKKLASYADIFVNDAFGTAHRAHSSTVGVAKYLEGYAGFLMEKEIEFLGNAIENPERPFLAILGGAKVSDKIGVITALLDTVDTIAIGGGMAYTFIKALGYEVGTSLCELDKLEVAKEIMRKATEKNVKLLLPVDVVIADSITSKDIKTVSFKEIPANLGGFDAGEKTLEIIEEEVKKSKTIFWNGPLGAFEFEQFLNGTKKIAEVLADTDCISIIGGGDSAAAVKKLGIEDKFTHISTGGGASLRLLEGKELPGLVALSNK